jgi:hypothetical protein
MYIKDASDHTWSMVDITLTLMYDLDHNDQQWMLDIPSN